MHKIDERAMPNIIINNEGAGISNGMVLRLMFIYLFYIQKVHVLLMPIC